MRSADRGARLALGSGPLLLLAGLCGCSSSLTELIVDVHSDLAVPGALDEIVVTAVGPSGVSKDAQATLAGAASLPVTVGLRPGGDENAPVTIHVRGLRGATEQVAVHVSTHFIAGERRILRIDLTADCVGVPCAAGETCKLASCVLDDVDPAALPHFTGTLPDRDDDAGPSDAGPSDAGPSDAGPGDAAPPDEGSDAPPGCVNDLDCTDDDACNGVEHCDAGVCLPGTPLSCDDGVGCTIDGCVASACVHTATDAACTVLPGGTCDATFGCQYPTCTPGICADDGCTQAMCDGATCVRTSICVGATPMCCADGCVADGCDDGNPCTADSCGVSGCEHTPTPGVLCSDGNACTTGETCDALGTCRGGSAVRCNDFNSCTSDSCSPVIGCVFVSTVGSCDDANACTVGETCLSGLCGGGLTVLCPRPTVECRQAVCDPVAGCTEVLVPTGTGCNDLDNCTRNDRCLSDGSCAGIPFIPCTPA